MKVARLVSIYKIVKVRISIGGSTVLEKEVSALLVRVECYEMRSKRLFFRR
jgi:hypothetical protein